MQVGRVFANKKLLTFAPSSGKGTSVWGGRAVITVLSKPSTRAPAARFKIRTIVARRDVVEFNRPEFGKERRFAPNLS